jgi:DNA mismatch endonuclease (patch repair protein)
MPTSDNEARNAARRWKDVDPERSRTMSLVRGKNTTPEMAVRRMVHKMGYRYGLHATDLPGRPDLVFRSRKKVVFVHGCYWHGHKNPACRLARLPKSRVEFWAAKIARNGERDITTERALKDACWKVLTIWECQLKNPQVVAVKLKRFLDRK